MHVLKPADDSCTCTAEVCTLLRSKPSAMGPLFVASSPRLAGPDRIPRSAGTVLCSRSRFGSRNMFHGNRLVQSFRCNRFPAGKCQAMSPRMGRHSLSRRPNDEKDPEGKSIDRELVSLALPALGALALDPILSLVDTAFIGRLGDAAPIAGLSIASIVLSISFSIFSFLAVATTPLVARALRHVPALTDAKELSGRPEEPSQGREQSLDDDPSAASPLICAGIFLASTFGLVSGSFMVLQAPAICRALGASSAVLPHAVGYLRARAIVTPIVLISFVGNGAFRGFKDTKTPFLIAIVANVVNLVLDPLLIFTFGMGAQGAAVATSASQIVAVILTIVALIQGGRLRVRDLGRIPSIYEVIPFLQAGASLTIRSLSILGTVAYATATASTLGTGSLAAFEITRQMFVLHAMVLDSIAGAAQAMVSSLLAQGSMVRARLVANRSLQLGAMFGALIGLVAVGLGPSLPRLFTRDPEACTLAVSCVRVAALCTPLNGAVFALDGVLAAARDYSFMAVAIAFAGFVAVVVLTAVRWTGGGVTAVWGGLDVLMIARAGVLITRYISPSGPIPPIRDVSCRRL